MSDRLIDLIREVAGELDPGRPIASIGLDDSLERKAGLDSLGRLELLGRIERELSVRLPERAALEAETGRDLLEAIESVGGPGAAVAPADAPRVSERPPPPPPPRDEAARDGVVPEEATTLLEMLHWRADRHPERTYMDLYGEDDRVEPISYRALLEHADQVAAGLREAGVGPGEAVAIMLPTGRDFFGAFWGAVVAGAVPVPLYPPHRPSQIEDHLRRQAGILASCRAPLLVTVPEARRVGSLLTGRVPELRELATASDLVARGAAGGYGRPHLRADDVAFLQYTSGSTGQPKGVVLTHRNLLENIRAFSPVEPTDRDVFVSWLPLYHDMGLIGACLGTLYWGIHLVLMSPLRFLSRPSRWLRAIHEHGGTVSAAPNFAYEICAGKVDDADIEGIDLSRWRIALNGAEPVSPQTIRRFTERFEPFGFRPAAMMPVYGLAENALAVSFPPLGRHPRVERVARGPLAREGRAVPVDEGEDADDALAFVSSGLPLPGNEVRIVDAEGEPVGERVQGRLEFRGPSATSGYFRNEEATARLLDGDWRDSGDQAYIADGEIYITGRTKDLIIKGGRNIYPQELEEAVGEIEGARKGCVAVFGTRGGDAERLIVLVETRLTDEAARARLREAVADTAIATLGVAADDVVLGPPGAVLKTSSGKVRRDACRQLYEAGRLGRPRAVWWQLVRLALGGAGGRARRALARAGRAVYAVWAWAVVALLIGPAFLGVALLPGRRARRAWARLILRLARALALIPLRTRGLEHLAGPGGRVIVVNHSSYLDPLILFPLLPPDHVFAAKAEFRERWFTRTLLSRLGEVFVERHDARAGAEDTEHLARICAEGRAVVFFPEGTFVPAPGLMRFRMGAFVVAARDGVPVVPVAIRGARAALRDGSWTPRRRPIEVTVGEPIAPEADGWAESLRLRDEARAAILRHCGEPDLVRQPVPERAVS